MKLVYFSTVYSLGAQKPVVKKALTARGGGGGGVHTYVHVLPRRVWFSSSLVWDRVKKSECFGPE